MDARPCQNCCCSPFGAFQDEEITRTPDLTNPIHPIFRRNNFTNISQRDYNLFRPSLQLASLLLESDALIPFILTMVDGEIHLANGTSLPYSLLKLQNTGGDPTVAWDVYAAPRAGQTEINVQNRQRVSEILTAMADMITFGVGDHSAETEVSSSSLGYVATLHGCLTYPLQQAFPRGCRSYTSISANMLTWLQRMTSQDAVDRGKNHCAGCTPSKRLFDSEYLDDVRSCPRCCVTLSLLTWRFHLAETFVHEFAHALHNATYGRQRELPHAPGSIAETGFEICNQLFGGILEISPRDLVETPCNGNKPHPIRNLGTLTDWPSTVMAEAYSADGQLVKPVSFKADQDVIHRIPFSYFEDLFSVTFWNRVRREGAQVLKPPKMGTWCFRWQQSPVQRYCCCSTEQNTNRLATEETDAASELNSMSSTAVQTILSTGNDCSKKLESKQCLGKRTRRLSSLGNLTEHPGYWYEIDGFAVLQ